jgi:hypothetical protein
MSDSYRERAEQCIREAEVAIVPELKPLFLDMAECWSRLAEQSDNIKRLAEGSPHEPTPPKRLPRIEAWPTWVRPAANVIDIVRWRELNPRHPSPLASTKRGW